LSASGKLQPGDPVVVQFLLRNTTDEKRTVILQQYDHTVPVLGANNRITLNISGSSQRRHQHEIGPGEILNLRQYRVTVSTEGLLPGEYYVTAQPAFWYSEKGKPNSGTGIGRQMPIPFTLGDPKSVKFTAPPKVEDPKKRIHWGKRVGGLLVGMRLPGGRLEWGTNARIEAEMFIRNVSSGPIECEYEIPTSTDWNFNVESKDGKDVRLDLSFSTGWRSRVTRTVKLDPGEQVPLTGLVAEVQVGGIDPEKTQTKKISGPTLQILVKTTKFTIGDPKRLITTGGSYLWSAWVTVRQKESDLSMVIGSSPVPFDIKTD